MHKLLTYYVYGCLCTPASLSEYIVQVTVSYYLVQILVNV